MKKILALSFALFTLTVQAQFAIQGKIENLNEKPVGVRIFKGSSDKLINKVTTDKNGNFSVNIPEKYSGVIRIHTMHDNAFLNVISDNEEVVFESKYENGEFTDPVFTKGKTAIAYSKYEEYEKFNDLKTSVFPTIKTMYKENDEFYKAIIKEEERISKTAPNLSLPFLKYYIQTLDLVKTQIENPMAAEVHRNKILHKLVNDNDYLEGSGLMNQLVLDYLRYSIMNATSQEQVNQTIDQEINHLITETDLETPRGQNVLTSVFAVLPKEQFASMLEKYYEKANALTCEITDELQISLNTYNHLKPGNVVPNIIFEKPIKGYKSLHDVKADKKIVMFWASWCPACNDEMPFVKEYYRNFKADGGEIISISLDIDQASFDQATKDFEWINYTELLRWDTQGVAEFGVMSTPTLFLLDKDNKLIKSATHISELVEF